MLIVTTGFRYLDIDGYACCVAYAELLNALGNKAQAVSTAPANGSITASLRALNAPMATTYSPDPTDTFIAIDLSDPAIFDHFVDQDRVVEVIDHHPGFEDYWATRPNVKAHIEFIGAAATLIVEAWQREGKLQQMSQASAKLLAAAIVDNTLNFGASVTTQRDKDAFALLAKHANLGDTWVANYFEECQQAITADLTPALVNDTKFLDFQTYPHKLCVGQLVVWDAKPMLDVNATIAKVLGGMQDEWFCNVVSIADGCSYFVAKNAEVQRWLQKLLDITFKNNIAKADRLWLRKEIMKADIAYG